MENAHLSNLRAKHAELDRRIADESHRPQPDGTRLHQLKKEKLRVKEEIVQLH